MASVAAWRMAPVSRFLAVRAAAGTTEPEGSVTTPEMAADTCAWAKRGDALAATHQAARRDTEIEPGPVTRIHQPPPSRKAQHSISDATKIQIDCNRFTTANEPKPGLPTSAWRPVLVLGEHDFRGLD